MRRVCYAVPECQLECLSKSQEECLHFQNLALLSHFNGIQSSPTCPKNASSASSSLVTKQKMPCVFWQSLASQGTDCSLHLVRLFNLRLNVRAGDECVSSVWNYTHRHFPHWTNALPRARQVSEQHHSTNDR